MNKSTTKSTKSPDTAELARLRALITAKLAALGITVTSCRRNVSSVRFLHRFDLMLNSNEALTPGEMLTRLEADPLLIIRSFCFTSKGGVRVSLTLWEPPNAPVY